MANAIAKIRYHARRNEFQRNKKSFKLIDYRKSRFSFDRHPHFPNQSRPATIRFLLHLSNQHMDCLVVEGEPGRLSNPTDPKISG